VWFEKKTGNLVTNTRWAATAPAWLTEFNRERAIDSFHGWMWQRSGPADAYAGLVDDRPYESEHGNGSKQRTLPQALTGGTAQPGAEFYSQLYASPVGNTMVRRAAEHVTEALRVARGQGAAAVLMAPVPAPQGVE
jgi:hypothetical protein